MACNTPADFGDVSDIFAAFSGPQGAPKAIPVTAPALPRLVAPIDHLPATIDAPRAPLASASTAIAKAPTMALSIKPPESSIRHANEIDAHLDRRDQELGLARQATSPQPAIETPAKEPEVSAADIAFLSGADDVVAADIPAIGPDNLDDEQAFLDSYSSSDTGGCPIDADDMPDPNSAGFDGEDASIDVADQNDAPYNSPEVMPEVISPTDYDTKFTTTANGATEELSPANAELQALLNEFRSKKR